MSRLDIAQVYRNFPSKFNGLSALDFMGCELTNIDPSEKIDLNMPLTSVQANFDEENSDSANAPFAAAQPDRTSVADKGIKKKKILSKLVQQWLAIVL